MLREHGALRSTLLFVRTKKRAPGERVGEQEETVNRN
jgi:hypothetical protein